MVFVVGDLHDFRDHVAAVRLQQSPIFTPGVHLIHVVGVARETVVAADWDRFEPCDRRQFAGADLGTMSSIWVTPPRAAYLWRLPAHSFSVKPVLLKRSAITF
jgi:hypothetical protein